MLGLPNFTVCQLDPVLVQSYLQQIEILTESQELGARIYPLISGLALLVNISKNV
jgi:hypothetical protein